MKAPAVLLALVVTVCSAWGADGRPNIVLILTDDLDFNSIADNLGKTIDRTVFMPRLKAMADQGLTFTNAFVTFALCCPARSSILRGQYPHNTGVLGNAPPLGGFQTFYRLGHESSTIGTWLKAAGYRTALIGRYLNGYPVTAGPVYVPPGWDEWRIKTRATSIQMAYLDYYRVENSVSVYYPPAPDNYLTDTETGDVARFIQNSDERPFFIYLAPLAPHGPSTPAPRHANLFPSARAPKPPSFNEADVSDKPAWIQALPLFTPERITAIDNTYRNRLRSMMAVDDMIGRVIDELGAKGKLDNTYIFFTSDNGLHMGQHRMTPLKGSAYEEDIRVPLIVVGPGAPRGTRAHVVLNNDFAPTFADLAGAAVPGFVDGRSFRSLLTNQPPLLDNWRSSFLVEYAEGADPSFSAPSYYAMRILKPQENILYNELAAGGPENLGNEFYDLATDPFQLNNRYSSIDPSRRNIYSRRLDDLKNCRAANCRAAEDTLVPPAAPMGLTATAFSATQINLAWRDSSNNETGFKIERSTDNVTFVQLPLKGENATTHTSAGLLSGTRYYYRVRAYNAAGNSAYSNIASATALGPPTPPSGLTATAFSATRINLAWRDSSNNETGFKIERSTDNVTFVQLPLKGENATTHTSAGLLSGTRYYYRVRAYNAAGNSAYSNIASATALGPPTPPSGLTATAFSATRINLAWRDSSNNETGFKIERSPDNVTFVQLPLKNATTHTSAASCQGRLCGLFLHLPGHR